VRAGAAPAREHQLRARCAIITQSPVSGEPGAGHEAEWRVKPLVPSVRRVPEKEGFDADIWSSATRL